MGKEKVYVGHLGPFASAGECFYAGHDVVYTCYGKNNGGSWTYQGKSINVNFCKW
ncbi:hypothetical protein AJ78_07276 [Emergomyces pasteurianus Ep9510]|uniref:Uncharacterized protein n=1 Tax=Emergomyces pasteurianus Ep9510 TaxID=1447872 RepID=A0A1J9Q786_9EURO|nr:hypothetical protein AJ78_07276 [Emergomyces pasteurianus Ep9510]